MQKREMITSLWVSQKVLSTAMTRIVMLNTHQKKKKKNQSLLEKAKIGQK